MALCLNRTSPGYLTLLNMSGVPGFNLDVIISHYLEKYGRFPRINEIPNADSSKFLAKETKAKEDIDDEGKYLDVSETNMKNYLQTDTLSEESILIALNKKHLDLLISVCKIGKKYRIRFKNLPTKYANARETNPNWRPSDNTKDTSIRTINKCIDNVLLGVGIPIVKITDVELAQPQWRNIMQGRGTVKAFIYNNTVYINTDHATIDDKLHELLHIVLGATAMQDPELYLNILDTIGLDEEFIKSNISKYPNRARMDVLEEILVSELSKHVSGLKSKIQDLDPTILEQLYDNIAKAFNRVFDVEQSAEKLSFNAFMGGSLYELGTFLKSSYLDAKVIDYSQIRRQMANTIEKLIRNNKLEERCE